MNRKFDNENEVFSSDSGSLNLSGYSKPANIIPAEKKDDLEPASVGAMNISWLGHSSTLVQICKEILLLLAGDCPWILPAASFTTRQNNDT